MVACQLTTCSIPAKNCSLLDNFKNSPFLSYWKKNVMPFFVFSHVLNIYQNNGSTVHAKQWFLCTITCFCRYLYSPYIAPGGQSKTPFFLLFIRACCQFFLLHRPAGFSRLLLLLLLPPLPVPPLSTAVQVQRCRWCRESRRHTHTSSSG